MAERKLKARVLYLACTRPSLTWGMPTEAFAMCMCASGFVVVIFKNPIYFAAVLGALCLICRQVVKHDHNAFRVIAAWMDTKVRCATSEFWRGSTSSHLPRTRSTPGARGIV